MSSGVQSSVLRIMFSESVRVGAGIGAVFLNCSTAQPVTLEISSLLEKAPASLVSSLFGKECPSLVMLWGVPAGFQPTVK